MKGDQRFGKHERLRLREDFARVFALRCSAGNGLLVIYVAGNGLRWSRLGVSVSRRLGNAVMRHSITRRIREAFRLQKESLPAGLDIVCVAKAPACDRVTDISASLRDLAEKAAQKLARRTSGDSGTGKRDHDE